jgi:hypothetical protein
VQTCIGEESIPGLDKGVGVAARGLDQRAGHG